MCTKQSACRFAAVVVLGLVCLAAPGRARAQGSVGGKVTDEQGAALSGAQISLDQSGKGAVSGADGSYLIDAVTAGVHTVRARLIGYRGQTASVTVSGSQRATHNFTLASDPLNLEAVVVTATGVPRTKLETSNATTVLSAADLVQAAPRSTTEMLRYVPGFTRVESSGGEVNENIGMRGILGVEYVMFLEDGLPVFPTMHTYFMNADNLFRIDDNVERVEVVRGAGSALFGSNTPGAIVNLINHTGGPEVRGTMTAYGGTGSLARYNFNVNGPIGPDWRFNAGGFYRYNRGTRDPGYPGTTGGQFKGSITRNFTNGFFRTSLKIIDDRNQFILPLPFDYPDTSNLRAYQYVPGFSNYGSMNTNEGNNITVPTPDGQLLLPLDNGLRTKAYWLTVGAGFNLAHGWNVENTAQLMHDQQEWNAILPFDVQDTATAVSTYLPQYWGSYRQGRVTVPAGDTIYSVTARPAKYTLTYPNVLDVNGKTTAYNNSNGLLSPGGEWHVSKPLSAFQDQLTFKKAFEGGHNVTLGAYFANYSQTNQWYFTDILMDVRDNPHFVDLRVDSADVYYHYRNRTTGANDSTLVPVRNLAATKNGFRRFVSNYANGEGQTTVFSVVGGGSLQLSKRLRADLGIRYENDKYVQTSQNSTTIPVNGDTLNSLNLFNQDIWGVSSSYRHFSRSIGDWAASVGANYALTDQTSLYALGSRAYKMPALDDFLFASVQQQVALYSPKRNWTGEVGAKHASRNVGVTLDGFYTVLKNIVSQGLVVDPITGQSIWTIQQNPEVRSYGLELEAEGRLPNTGFGAVTNWTWLRAEFASCPPPNFCGSGADGAPPVARVPPIVRQPAITSRGRAGVDPHAALD